MPQKIDLMIVAGEASGDELGAQLVEEIRRREPEAGFFGTPGPKMRAAGVEAIFESDHWSIVGVAAVVKAVPKFTSILRKLRSVAAARKPDAVILIDFPEFNLKLAKSLHRDGHKIIYYVSPQLWAWRKYRIRTIRNYVDKLLSILPFEEEWYRKQGIEHVEYVGNPHAERVKPKLSRDEFCKLHGLDPKKNIVALLPGSRKKEIERILPELLKTACLMYEKDASIQFVIAASSTSFIKQIDAVVEKLKVQGLKFPKTLIIVQNETFDALNAADAAAVASGTATLEAGIIGTPMAIVYNVSRLDEIAFRPLINTEHFGLINLVAGKRIVNEYIQEDFNAQTLSNELLRLLDPSTNSEMRMELTKANDNLAVLASKNAAESVLEFLT